MHATHQTDFACRLPTRLCRYSLSEPEKVDSLKPKNEIDDISVRTLLNVTNYILINKKHIDLCEKRKIIYFIENDDMICIGYTILTRYGLVEYPIINMVHIRQNKLIKSLIRKSKVLKNIQTNKLFTTYVCFTKKANMDTYVVKEIFHYL